MSEYIVCPHCHNPLGQAEFVRVVRCRDCRWSRIHDGKTYPKGEAYKGKMYCIVWSDGYQGEWTSPDGYCHRAKRREIGE